MYAQTVGEIVGNLELGLQTAEVGALGCAVLAVLVDRQTICSLLAAATHRKVVVDDESVLLDISEPVRVAVILVIVAVVAVIIDFVRVEELVHL